MMGLGECLGNNIKPIWKSSLKNPPYKGIFYLYYGLINIYVLEYIL